MKNLLYRFIIMTIFFGFQFMALGQKTEVLILGDYYIPKNSEFSFVLDRSFGSFYVFENTHDNTSVYIPKSPVILTRSRDFKIELTRTAMDMYQIGFFKYKLSNSSYKLDFLNIPKAYFIMYAKPKKAKGKERMYFFYHQKDNQLFQSIIFSETGKNHPSQSSKDFITSIKMINQVINEK